PERRAPDRWLSLAGQSERQAGPHRIHGLPVPVLWPALPADVTQIDRDYVSTGRVRHVLRDFPLESIHNDAFKAAEAAHCAGDQGQYWQMHDRLFNSQNDLAADHLASYAGALGLDVPSFKQCLNSDKYAGKIRQDLADAQKVGVQATPSFLLGLVEPG